MPDNDSSDSELSSDPVKRSKTDEAMRLIMKLHREEQASYKKSYAKATND